MGKYAAAFPARRDIPPTAAPRTRAYAVLEARTMQHAEAMDGRRKAASETTGEQEQKTLKKTYN